MVRGEDPAERGAVVRCHPTRSDHHRGHECLVPSKAAADFPAAWHNAHINAKETLVLHEVLKLATTTHLGCLKGSTAVVDVGNKTMHDAFKIRKGVHGTRRPTTLLRSSSGCK